MLCSSPLCARKGSIMHIKCEQVMSKLLIVLDLRPVEKMWRGTRDVQTPQQVTMTLGNTGAIRPPSRFLSGCHCFYFGLSLEIQPAWTHRG